MKKPTHLPSMTTMKQETLPTKLSPHLRLLQIQFPIQPLVHLRTNDHSLSTVPPLPNLQVWGSELFTSGSFPVYGIDQKTPIAYRTPHKD